MRLAVALIALAYALLFGWAWYDTSSAHMDAAGRGMAQGFLVVGIGIAALFAGPALILAALGRAPKWALGLVLVPAAALLLALGAGIL